MRCVPLFLLDILFPYFSLTYFLSIASEKKLPNDTPFHILVLNFIISCDLSMYPVTRKAILQDDR